MKNREEYISNIYRKKDAAIKRRKKHLSYLTTAACIAVCFLTVFFLTHENKPKIKADPDYTLDNPYDQFIYETNSEEHTTSPAVNDAIEGLTEFRVTEDKSYFGNHAAEAEKNESFETTKISLKPATTTISKAEETTKQGSVISDIAGLLDVLKDSIPDKPFSESESESKPVQMAPPAVDEAPDIEEVETTTQKPSTTKAPKPPPPDTGGDDQEGTTRETNVAGALGFGEPLPESDYTASDALKKSYKYLSKDELNATGGKFPDTYIRLDSGKYHYRVCFTTDKATIIIKLDYFTLEFLGREEQPIKKTPVESTTVPQETTAITQATTVTQAVTENNNQE